jgi:dihydroorotate dehydrogenase electron transfer subunit
MIARGVGMATLAPLAEFAVKSGAHVTAVLSARSADLVMSEDYLQSVGAGTLVVTDHDGSSDVAHVEALLRNAHAARPVDLIATCGSNRLLQLLKQLAVDLQVPGQVSLEQQMGCAIGMCFACVRPFRIGDAVTYRRICCEGPVFELGEAISW